MLDYWKLWIFENIEFVYNCLNSYQGPNLYVLVHETIVYMASWWTI